MPTDARNSNLDAAWLDLSEAWNTPANRGKFAMRRRKAIPMKFMRVGVATFAGLLLASGLATAQSMATGANSVPVAAFTLVAPNGLSPSGLVARAIVARGNGCPFLNVTNIKGEMQSVEMRERSAPATTGAAFSAFTACSAHIPVGA